MTKTRIFKKKPAVQLEQLEQVKPEVGNTKTSGKKRIHQSKSWCFTLNNYLEQDIKDLKIFFKEKCEKFIFGRERGEQGTPHLQGYIYLYIKARPLEFCLNSKIHWERCKGNELENIIYCSKEGNYDKSDNINIPKKLKIIKDLRPWQLSIEKLLIVEPEDRKIIWVFEEEGGVGKSAFARYLINTYDSLYITEGKKTDIINMVYNYVLTKELNIVILDVPRSNGNKISYKSLEEIKNGIICNTKYETGCKVVNPAHILVFANEAPEVEKLSLDRWDIYEIKDQVLCHFVERQSISWKDL